VKGLLISMGAIFLIQLSLETFAQISISGIFGFVPARLLDGWLWQLLTYAFLHSGIFHLLFNLLVIWSIGGELERLWKLRTFSAFLLVCTLGASLTYGLFTLMGIGPGPNVPVIGSSGMVFGLMLAYGILFSERTMYFYIFPMQARYFVMLLIGVELIYSVFYTREGVAHFAHLGGMGAGFVFLIAMASWRKREKQRAARDYVSGERKKRLKKAGHLRLIPGGEDDDDDPKTWN